ncbi:MAG: hypothetical protein HQL64_15990 [Magnetococcales bacterium]|nr:hypothetical protein [Magnetococcales bacterium]
MNRSRLVALMLVGVSSMFFSGPDGVRAGPGSVRAWVDSYEEWLDCRVIPGPTVDTVCSYLDLYDKLSSVDGRASVISFGFSDAEMIETIDVDTLEWLFSLDNCDGDRPCLMNEFRKRLYVLGENNRSDPFVGSFSRIRHNKARHIREEKRVGIYPVDKKYLVGIIVELEREGYEDKKVYIKGTLLGKCEINGYGIMDGDRLLVTIGAEGDAVTFPITLRGSRTLIIEDSPEVRQIRREYCDSDLYFSGSFQRFVPEEKDKDFISDTED